MDNCAPATSFGKGKPHRRSRLSVGWELHVSHRTCVVSRCLLSWIGDEIEQRTDENAGIPNQIPDEQVAEK